MRRVSAYLLTNVAAALIAISGAAAESPTGSTGPMQLAQGSGYDPMRRALPSPGGTELPPGNPELGGLPDAPGAEDTFYMCSACHSIALVRQQRLTDARWDYLWEWMIEEQGMADPGEELREIILGYLKKHFSSER